MLTDVSRAFLNAFLGNDERFAVEIPMEFKDPGKDQVWVLMKALYGLRGAPRFWQDPLVDWLNKHSCSGCHWSVRICNTASKIFHRRCRTRQKQTGLLFDVLGAIW